MGWRYIDSAPEDGTRILAVLSDIKGGKDLGKIVDIVFYWRGEYQRVDEQCGGHYPVEIDAWMELPGVPEATAIACY